VAELAERTAVLAADLDIMLIEGAGGVLVRLDTNGGTIADLGLQLRDRGLRVTSVIVTTLALGTLNHTELTAMALRSADIHVSGLVIGSESSTLGLAEGLNRTELRRVTGLPVLGSVPAGAGGLRPSAFRDSAAEWLPNIREALGPANAQR
jgi:dethiobiotin synthetase